VPIVVEVQQQRGSRGWVPAVVSRDSVFRLMDRNGQLANASELTITRNTALSSPMYLPLAALRATIYRTLPGPETDQELRQPA